MSGCPCRASRAGRTGRVLLNLCPRRSWGPRRNIQLWTDLCRRERQPCHRSTRHHERLPQRQRAINAGERGGILVVGSGCSRVVVYTMHSIHKHKWVVACRVLVLVLARRSFALWI